MQNNTNQPQVRSGSLPTNTPNVQQRTATRQPQQRAAEPEAINDGFDEQVDVAAAPAAKKPRKPRAAYTRKKIVLSDGCELSETELATLGKITIKANQAGITPQRYIENLKKMRGSDEIAVWDKVASTSDVAAEATED